MTSWTADEWNGEGLRLMRKRDYPAAYQAFEKAVALRPDLASARRGMEEARRLADPQPPIAQYLSGEAKGWTRKAYRKRFFATAILLIALAVLSTAASPRRGTVVLYLLWFATALVWLGAMFFYIRVAPARWVVAGFGIGILVLGATGYANYYTFVTPGY